MTGLLLIRPRQFIWRRVLVMLAALIVVGGILALLAWAFWPQAPKTPARMPFGMAREAAPATSGIAGYFVAWQGVFYKGLTDAVSALKDGHGTLWPLLTVGFLYGVFHAAGPGHGKGVISAYLVANGRSLVRGLGICLAAALLQAAVAIAIVSTAVILLHTTARQMNAWTDAIETGCFAVIALVGLMICWRKAGKFLAVLAQSRGNTVDPALLACDHVHLPPPDEIDRMPRWRDRLGVIIAAGSRPCSGALIILVFALSQGLFAAGIMATFAMALGTAITTGIIAAIAVFAKVFALKLAGGRSSGLAPIAVPVLELMAGAFVTVLGISLIFGLWIEAGMA